jgi:hypothetical protein
MCDRIKKAVMVLIILGMAFGILSGCGSNDQATGNKAADVKAGSNLHRR